MIEKLKALAPQIQAAWNWAQEFVSVKGGLYVDMFAVIFLLRLLGPLFGWPALTFPEAGVWAATIGAFVVPKGPRQS